MTVPFLSLINSVKNLIKEQLRKQLEKKSPSRAKGGHSPNETISIHCTNESKNFSWFGLKLAAFDLKLIFIMSSVQTESGFRKPHNLNKHFKEDKYI